MDKKTLTKILSFAITAGFFLPIFEWHSFEMSGLNFILSDHIARYKYFLVLIPIPSLLLFFEVQNERSLFFKANVLCWLPLLSLVFVFIMMSINTRAESSFYNYGNIFSTVDIGFWLLLICSSILVFITLEKKSVNQYEDVRLF